MNQLKMGDSKLRIMDQLVIAGYLPAHQDTRVKWSKGRSNCVWFEKHAIRTTINSEAAAIIRRVVGEPNASITEARRQGYDTWYTDGCVSLDAANA